MATHVRALMLDPAPVLRQVAQQVSSVATAQVQALAQDLMGVAAAQGALGIAAPQIGESVRIFAMRTPRAFYHHPLWGGGKDSTTPYLAMINPVVTARSSQMLLGPEACLSMPDETFLVPRHTVLGVRYLTETVGRNVCCLREARDVFLTSLRCRARRVVVQGEERAHSLTGLPAVVFQHELDHLDGVLMCDRAVTEEEKEELKKQGKVRQSVCVCVGAWRRRLALRGARRVLTVVVRVHDRAEL